MILLQSRRKMLSHTKLFGAAAIALAITVHGAYASDATWNLNPVDNNWNNAANWTPAIVPDGQATFDASNTTDISADGANIGSIVFNPGASAFRIKQQANFNITGLGIINNSASPQNFVSPCGVNCTSINFSGTTTVSGPVTCTTEGNRSGDYAWGSAINFHGSSSAGDGTYHNQGGSVGQSWGRSYVVL